MKAEVLSKALFDFGLKLLVLGGVAVIHIAHYHYQPLGCGLVVGNFHRQNLRDEEDVGKELDHRSCLQLASTWKAA